MFITCKRHEHKTIYLLRFFVDINDIVNDINNDIRLFADDTSLFVVVENDHAAAATSLTNDLNVISKWAKKWAIQFNPQKNKKYCI